MNPRHLEALFSLSHKIAVVTGGASGIGAGISSVLAQAGAEVVIADINIELAAEKAGELRNEGLKASAVAIDLSDEASVKEASRRIVKEYGTPWVLVNNAGLQHRKLLFDTSGEEWDKTLDVNTRGPFFILRELGKAMADTGEGGRVINIASNAVLGSITRGHAAYASSKSALMGLTNAAALELAAYGITVNAILPGGVVTPGAIHATGPKPEGPAIRTPPLGLSEPEDIGAAVLFLASPAARKISNQAIAVDGGWTFA